MVKQALRTETQRAELDQQPSSDGEVASRLDAFPSESEGVRIITHVEPSPAVSEHPARTRLVGVAAVCVVLIAATAGVVWMRTAILAGSAGALRVETDVAGANVTIDGTYRGKTPLLLSLDNGDYTVRIDQGSQSRTLPVSIAQRTTVVHHISWPAATAAPMTTGGLEIVSDPRGQAVSIDGQPRGVTPLTISDLTPGNHEVLVRKDASTVRRTVQVKAGETSSLMFASGASGPASGWLSVTVPIPLQVFEDGRLIGSSQSDRILVPSGAHTYDLVNEALGFRMSQAVQVATGQTANISVQLPRGSINVNAVPWAQVWLDGQPLGETPIGNVSWTIGTHEIVLRHPDLGERRVSTTITTGEAARVAVDMRKAQ
ncbi:MAG: PEGA domain-containing protein [Vicinamibacterales bacterium]